MSIALENRIRELEQRILILEALVPHDGEEGSKLTLPMLWGEIKTIKMRMARDGKRTSSAD